MEWSELMKNTQGKEPRLYCTKEEMNASMKEGYTGWKEILFTSWYQKRTDFDELLKIMK